jgi:glycerophosphoryl diester phosphodiesterase
MINVHDFEAVGASRPFLVAHRGGVITRDSPENSMAAIERAGQRGYAMVELDVMEAADHEPVLLHDGLFINCGVRARIHALPSAEITRIRYRASDQPVITLAQAVEACARLAMGIMLDKLCKDDPADSRMSARCLDRVASLIRDAGLASATVAIVDSPGLRERLGDVALFPIAPAAYDRILETGRADVAGGFWFGWAADLPDRGVAALHANRAFAIVSINTFHYPHHAPDVLARDDIRRLKAAQTDGFQIDSVFESYARES